MKFIGNFCLCLIFFMTSWVVTLLFASNASIYSWCAAIAVSVSYALFINRNKGKHDE